jgi:hypothetical protein
MREHAASDKPVAFAIALSENASSFGAISRLKHASPGHRACDVTAICDRSRTLRKNRDVTLKGDLHADAEQDERRKPQQYVDAAWPELS